MPKISIVCENCKIVFFDYSSNKRRFCSHKCSYPLKYTKEMKEKMSLIKAGRAPNNKGKKATTEAKIHQSCGRRKIKYDQFTGFVKAESTLERVKFRNEIQKQVLKRDDYTCQMCGERGGKLQVDHIQPWSEYIELRFNIDNCRTLCMACHYKITFGRPLPKGVNWGHNLNYKIKGL